ncbi:hypothetical protein pb186bvf_020654 [Paramecium bursaria]
MDQDNEREAAIEVISRFLDYYKCLKPAYELLKIIVESVTPFKAQERRNSKRQEEPFQKTNHHFKTLRLGKNRILETTSDQVFKLLRNIWVTKMQERSQMFYLIDIIQIMWIELVPADDKADTVVQVGATKSWVHQYLNNDPCLQKLFQIIVDSHCNSRSKGFQFINNFESTVDVSDQTIELLDLINTQMDELTLSNNSLVDRCELEVKRQQMLIERKNKALSELNRSNQKMKQK